jgi:protoheme IX farnesyltransferase
VKALAPPVPRSADATQGSARATVLAYVRLTKPRIVELLLVTTVPAMILAAGGLPSVWRLLATLAGGTLTAGGANAINQFYDRDIDEVMTRTRRRPLPRHQVSPRGALMFGLAIGAAGFALLLAVVNLPAALLALAAMAFYVFVYTVWLKRTSPQNIVIGGAAGAVPVLVGWAAVTGRVGWPAWILFGIVFLWTPPHFWALSLRYERDYAAAGVPMLPVVAGRAATARQILAYSVVLVLFSLLLWPVGHTGWLYPVAAVALGAVFVARAVRLLRHRTTRNAIALFRYSIVYLATLFAALAVDVLVRRGA